jgi:hypothetical protein
MKNVLFTALAALVMLTIACNKLDENLTDSMASEMETRQKGLADYMARNQAIAEFNVAASNAPVSLYNDPSIGFATVKDQITMLANKYQGTVDVYIEHITRLTRLQEDYRNGKIKTEEAKQELESITTNFKGIVSTFERVDEFYKKSSDEYAAIMNTWTAAHPAEAAALKANPSKPGGSISASAPGTFQATPPNLGAGGKQEEPKKQ